MKALRAIGRRRLALNAAARALARRLAQSEEPECPWIGQDARRELAIPQMRSPPVRRAR